MDCLGGVMVALSLTLHLPFGDVHRPVCWLFTGLWVGCSQACVLAVNRPVCWLFTGLCIWLSLARVLAVHRPVYWVFIGACIIICSYAFVLSVNRLVFWLFTGPHPAASVASWPAAVA